MKKVNNKTNEKVEFNQCTNCKDAKTGNRFTMTIETIGLNKILRCANCQAWKPLTETKDEKRKRLEEELRNLNEE
jgi:hypothetical protein